MDDKTILDRIHTLIEREHQLRAGRRDGTIEGPSEVRELTAAEVELDQCWDLLRQRRAKRDFGQDADEAQARSATIVEHYWQ